MSLAEQTRQAVDRDPVLYGALTRNLINYAAAARALEVLGSEAAVADALRRYADTLETPPGEAPRIRLLRSGGDPASPSPR